MIPATTLKLVRKLDSLLNTIVDIKAIPITPRPADGVNAFRHLLIIFFCSAHLGLERHRVMLTVE